MARIPGDLWLKQARSDLLVAEHFKVDEPELYCHIVAKYQQAIEKGVKGLVASLREMGKLNVEPVFKHDLEHDMFELSRFRRGKRSTQDVAGEVSKWLDSENRQNIRSLCALAPRIPVGEELWPRNTEYPFQQPDGTWQVPCDAAAFSEAETRRFGQIAKQNLAAINRIILVARRVK